MNLFLCDSISSTKKKTAAVLLSAVWLCLAFAGGAGAADNDVWVTYRAEGNGTLSAYILDGDDRIPIPPAGSFVSVGKRVRFEVNEEGYEAIWTITVNNGSPWTNPSLVPSANNSIDIEDKNTYDVVGLIVRTYSIVRFSKEADGHGKLMNTDDNNNIKDDANRKGYLSMNFGKTTTFAAVPNEGYAAARWTLTGDGAVIIDSSEDTITVKILPDADVYIYVNASFDWIPPPITHAKVTFSAANGALTAATVDGDTIFSDDSVRIGQSVIFTAAPDEGYGVVYWKVNGDEPENAGSPLVYTLEVPVSSADPVDVEAVFEPYAEPPFDARYGVVRVGPNPVAVGGDAAIYWVGNRAVSGSLSIFDAVGNKIADVNVAVGNKAAVVKKVGVWKVGGDVAAGVYLLYGVLRDKDGFKVKVSKPVGVVR